MQTEWKHSPGGQMPPPSLEGENEDGVNKIGRCIGLVAES